MRYVVIHHGHDLEEIDIMKTSVKVALVLLCVMACYGLAMEQKPVAFATNLMHGSMHVSIVPLMTRLGRFRCTYQSGIAVRKDGGLPREIRLPHIPLSSKTVSAEPGSLARAMEKCGNNLEPRICAISASGKAVACLATGFDAGVEKTCLLSWLPGFSEDYPFILHRCFFMSDGKNRPDMLAISDNGEEIVYADYEGLFVSIAYAVRYGDFGKRYFLQDLYQGRSTDDCKTTVALALSAEGDAVACGCLDGSVWVWGRMADEDYYKFVGKENFSDGMSFPSCISFSRRGDLVIVGSTRGCCMVLGLKDGRLIKLFEEPSSVWRDRVWVKNIMVLDAEGSVDLLMSNEEHRVLKNIFGMLRTCL